MMADAKLNVDDVGNIQFDPLPDLGEFKADADGYKSDGSRPGILGDMARGWVDFVQPNGFPTGKCGEKILVMWSSNSMSWKSELLILRCS